MENVLRYLLGRRRPDALRRWIDRRAAAIHQQSPVVMTTHTVILVATRFAHPQVTDPDGRDMPPAMLAACKAVFGHNHSHFELGCHLIHRLVQWCHEEDHPMIRDRVMPGVFFEFTRISQRVGGVRAAMTLFLDRQDVYRSAQDRGGSEAERCDRRAILTHALDNTRAPGFRGQPIATAALPSSYDAWLDRALIHFDEECVPPLLAVMDVVASKMADDQPHQ